MGWIIQNLSLLENLVIYLFAIQIIIINLTTQEQNESVIISKIRFYKNKIKKHHKIII